MLELKQLKYLFRIHSVIRAPTDVLQRKVESERLLLQSYNVAMPTVPERVPFLGHPDAVSSSILRRYHPVILQDYFPLEVYADGNCMYRAISRGLYGHENLHLLIRLLATLEMMEHSEFYDQGCCRCKELIGEDTIVCDPYSNLILAVVKLGRWSELLHMYAVSAALSVAIR